MSIFFCQDAEVFAIITNERILIFSFSLTAFLPDCKN